MWPHVVQVQLKVLGSVVRPLRHTDTVLSLGLHVVGLGWVYLPQWCSLDESC